MMAMGKKYDVYIWEVSFFMMDEDGNELLNEDGSVKLFLADDIDYSSWADGVNPNDLKEIN
tara:strand:+ start:404 stop:586 length:183 start_codon:yes stop_codon:yes gene_type:complete